MADYVDDFCGAVNVLIDSALSKLEYDKTSICTIESIENAENGEYLVYDGSTYFYVYSSGEYEENDKVLVSLSNGSYENAIIKGKYVEDDESYYNYTSPLKQFIDFTGNLVDGNIDYNSLGLIANDERKSETIEAHYIGRESILIDKDINEEINYDRMALQVDFKTLLESLNADDGTYGLHIYITYQNYLNTEGVMSSEKIKRYNISVDDMYGNPYNYKNFMTQEKLFDISDCDLITHIKVVLYQDSDFVDQFNNLIPYHEYDESGNEKLYPKNIFANNIIIRFGYDAADFDSDQVILYSHNGKTYLDNSQDPSSTNNNKQLSFRWIHFLDDNNIEVINSLESIPENTYIHWYKYILSDGIADDLAGAFWKEIPEAKNQIDFTVSPDLDRQTTLFKIIIETPSSEYIENYIETDEEILDLKAGGDNTKEEYDSAVADLRASIQYYKSNILTLTNEKEVVNKATVDLIQGLTIVCDKDGYKGIYKIYDVSNVLQDEQEANKKRIMTASFESLVTGEEDLDTAESITWQIPLNFTMIQPPEEGIEYTLYNHDEDGNQLGDKLTGISYETDGDYAYITRDLNYDSSNSAAGDLLDTKTDQIFRIKKYYVQTYYNNRVWCTVKKNGRSYKAAFDMTFGPAGTCGTDYNLEIALANKTEAITNIVNNETPVGVTAALYNYNNKLVGTDKYITFTWYATDGNIAFCNNNGDIYYNYIKATSDNYNSSNIYYEIDQAYIDEHGLTNATYAVKKYTSTITEDTNFDSLDLYIRSVSTSYEATLDPKQPLVPLLYLKEVDPTTVSKYNILKGIVSEEVATNDNKSTRNVLLSSFLPIAWRKEKEYVISGASSIVYDSLGTNPYYYDIENFKIFQDVNGDAFDSARVKWEVNVNSIEQVKATAKNLGTEDTTETKSTISSMERYYPSITEEGNLTVPNMYYQNLDTKVCLLCYIDDILSWVQPLLIIQNRYESTMINNWDGNLKIDDENGTILSTMVGAGIKNSDNTFDGVLMGNLRTTVNYKNVDKIGLYGFDSNEQSFGFKVDGTAFIGKSGHGRIEFDGNNGTIQSGDYKVPVPAKAATETTAATAYATGRGMKIDLDGDDGSSASMRMYGPYGGLIINTGNKTQLINLIDNTGKTLLGIGGNESTPVYFLQTSDYQAKTDTQDGKGIKIDLAQGRITAYSFTITAYSTEKDDTYDYTDSYILLDSDGDPYFRVHYSKRNIESNEKIEHELIEVSNDDLYFESQDFSVGDDMWDSTANRVARSI